MFFYKPHHIQCKIESSTSQNDVANDCVLWFGPSTIHSVLYNNKSLCGSLYDLPNSTKVHIKCPSKSDEQCFIDLLVMRNGELFTIIRNNNEFTTTLQTKPQETLLNAFDFEMGKFYLTTDRLIVLFQTYDSNINDINVFDFPLYLLMEIINTNDTLNMYFNPYYSVYYNNVLSIPMDMNTSEKIVSKIKPIRFSNAFGGESPKAFNEDTKNFHLCDTYPTKFVLPSSLPCDVIKGCSSFRSKCRIPICTYYNPINKSTIFRSSQPLVAKMSYFIGVLKDSTSLDDQKFLSEIRTLEKDDKSTLLILDCRPQTNAIANRVNGGGYENTSVYTNTNLEFLNIPNIHAVNDAFNKMRNALMKRKEYTPTTYYKEISDWFELLYGILKVVEKTVGLVMCGEHILIHCSDGWDRTAQLSSLVRLFLEKRYRTVKGFFDLLYQEWIGAGHQFKTRLHVKSNENSPVFIQFMELVSILVKHQPNAFQFGQDLLVRITSEACCPTTISFIMNCEKERFALNSSKYKDFFTHELDKYDSSFNPDTLQELNFDVGCNEYCVWHEYYDRDIDVVII
ncbi:Myotubularin phosphatase domain-containing protein [Entamoeba marina]